MRRRVFAQRRCAPGVAELDVVGADPDALLAQVFGQDAADFAVADESRRASRADR